MISGREKKRTSSGTEHGHTRCSAAYGASDGEEDKCRQHDGPPPDDLMAKETQ